MHLLLPYRKICDRKLPLGAGLGSNLRKECSSWEQSMSPLVIVPRPIAANREPSREVHLWAFRDASAQGVSAAFNGKKKQDSGETNAYLSQPDHV